MKYESTRLIYYCRRPCNKKVEVIDRTLDLPCPFCGRKLSDLDVLLSYPKGLEVDATIKGGDFG